MRSASVSPAGARAGVGKKAGVVGRKSVYLEVLSIRSEVYSSIPVESSSTHVGVSSVMTYRSLRCSAGRFDILDISFALG